MTERNDIGVMIEEIEATPQMVADKLPEFMAELQRRSPLFEGRHYTKVYAVGCGDSLYAAQAAQYAFMKNTGLPCQACEALEFCRYDVDYMPAGALVLVISYSGTVARTVECARMAKRAGATVVAITGKERGALAQTCGEAVVYHIDSRGFAPGTISFSASLLMLYACSVALGRANGYLTPDAAAAQHAQLAALPAVLRSALAAGRAPALAAAERYTGLKDFTIIGAGPNLAIAHYGAAKLIEGGEISGTPQELEEWAHIQYFTTQQRDCVVVIAPAGRCCSRAAELLAEMRFLGCGSVLVGTGDAGDLPADFALLAEDGVDEVYTPLVTGLLCALFAYSLSLASGKQAYDFPSQQIEEEHYRTIHHSAFRPEAEEVAP